MAVTTPEARLRNIVKLFESFGYRRDRHSVFADCIEAMALAMSNAVDHAQRDAREARYMEIVARYERDELAVFPQVLAEVTLALEDAPGDVLGAAFAALEVNNRHAGQFFTPYTVCRLMAGLQVGDGSDMRAIIDRHGFVSASEPACGAGAMIIALAEEMQARGINYQRHLHVTAVDIDRRAAHMAYTQFSLLHIPAVVVVGNALTLEEREHWYTPAHILGGWSRRLARRSERDADTAAPTPTLPAAVTPPRAAPRPPVPASTPTGQLMLF